MSLSALVPIFAMSFFIPSPRDEKHFEERNHQMSIFWTPSSHWIDQARQNKSFFLSFTEKHLSMANLKSSPSGIKHVQFSKKAFNCSPIFTILSETRVAQVKQGIDRFSDLLRDNLDRAGKVITEQSRCKLLPQPWSFPQQRERRTWKWELVSPG